MIILMREGKIKHPINKTDIFKDFVSLKVTVSKNEAGNLKEVILSHLFSCFCFHIGHALKISFQWWPQVRALSGERLFVHLVLFCSSSALSYS